MILFVCSQGRIRSRTAEVLALLGGMNARSCGTDKDALVPLSQTLLCGVDTVICLERHHVAFVRDYAVAKTTCIVSLGIEDVWDPFDPELIEQLISLTRLRLGDDVIADGLARGRSLMKANKLTF